MYLEGLHVEQDPDKAMEYLQKASDKGNQIAQAGMGSIYLKGIGIVDLALVLDLCTQLYTEN